MPAREGRGCPSAAFWRVRRVENQRKRNQNDRRVAAAVVVERRATRGDCNLLVAIHRRTT
jgi:hypothetical protein